MLINHTKYNAAGELLAPRPGDLNTKRAAPGGRPTTDPGYYHRFRFEAPTAEACRAKARRFFELMSAVPGFSSLVLRPYEVRVGGYYRTGLDIVYVVEGR